MYTRVLSFVGRFVLFRSVLYRRLHCSSPSFLGKLWVPMIIFVRELFNMKCPKQFHFRLQAEIDADFFFFLEQETEE